MSIKNLIVSLFTLGVLAFLQLEGALTPPNIPSQAACCSLGSTAPRIQSQFSCESFARQGIQLPPCDTAQARLWNNILQDPELQGTPTESSWSKWALPVALTGASGTMTAWSLWKLRKRQQETAERKEMEFRRQEIPTTNQPTTAIVIPANNSSTQTTPPIIETTTSWWQRPYAMPAACAAASVGGGCLVPEWNNRPKGRWPEPISTEAPTLPNNQEPNTTRRPTFVNRLDFSHVGPNPATDSTDSIFPRSSSDVLPTTQTENATGRRSNRGQNAASQARLSPTDSSPAGSPRSIDQQLAELWAAGFHPFINEQGHVAVPRNERVKHIREVLRVKDTPRVDDGDDDDTAPNPDRFQPLPPGTIARTEEGTQYSARAATTSAESTTQYSPPRVEEIHSLPRPESLQNQSPDTRNQEERNRCGATIAAAAPQPRQPKGATTQEDSKAILAQGIATKISNARTTYAIRAELGKIQGLQKQCDALLRRQTFELSVNNDGNITRVKLTQDEFKTYLKTLSARLNEHLTTFNFQRSQTAPTTAASRGN